MTPKQVLLLSLVVNTTLKSGGFFSGGEGMYARHWPAGGMYGGDVRNSSDRPDDHDVSVRQRQM